MANARICIEDGCDDLTSGKAQRCAKHMLERKRKSNAFHQAKRNRAVPRTVVGSERICKLCGNPFTVASPTQIYCLPIAKHPGNHKKRYDVKETVTGNCQNPECGKPVTNGRKYCNNLCSNRTRRLLAQQKQKAKERVVKIRLSKEKKPAKIKPRKMAETLAADMDIDQDTIDRIDAIVAADMRHGYNKHQPEKYIEQELQRVKERRNGIHH